MSKSRFHIETKVNGEWKPVRLHSDSKTPHYFHTKELAQDIAKIVCHAYIAHQLKTKEEVLKIVETVGEHSKQQRVA